MADQTETEAVDQLFTDTSPETESQGTPAEEQATTGAEQGAEGQQTAEAEPQAEQFFAEVAGRKYPTKEDFIKSHETLLEKSRRMEQESKAWKAAHDKWSPWEKWLRENPDFDRQLRAAEQKYRTARQQGATHAQAKAISGTQNVPPEILKKLEEHDTVMNEIQTERHFSALTSEMDALKGKYKMDSDTSKQVLSLMLDVAKSTGLDLPAEEAYWRIQAQQGKQALIQKDVELQRVKGSDGPVTTTGARTAKKALEKMSQKEFDAELLDQVNRMNLPE